MVKKKIFKPKNDDEFLEDVAFIIFVAGFRYSVVEKKWPNMTKAFSKFSVKKLASMKEKDIDKIMKAKDMIKNRGKIEAVIKNAQLCLEIKKEHGSVLKWIEHIKKENQKNPLLATSLEEAFQRFFRIGKTTSGWLAALHNAKKNYLEYKM